MNVEADPANRRRPTHTPAAARERRRDTVIRHGNQERGLAWQAGPGYDYLAAPIHQAGRHGAEAPTSYGPVIPTGGGNP